MKKYKMCYAPRRMSKLGVQMALEEFWKKEDANAIFSMGMEYFRANPKKTCWHFKQGRMKIRKYGENSFTVEEA